MATNILNTVNKRIKQIRRIHPSMTFKQAAAKAWKEYRSKHHKVKRIAGSRRRKKVHGPSVPHRERTDKKHVEIAIGTVAHHRSAIKKILEQKLSRLLVRRELSTTKRGRAMLSKEIREVKKEIRAAM